MPYNPNNWYWVVAGSTTQVFSSAAGSLVAVADATYATWRAAGNLPSPIGSWTELYMVLQQQAPAAWLRAIPALGASGALTLPQSAAAALALGLAVTSTGTPALDGTYAADPVTQQNMTAEVTAILLNATFADGTTTLAWPDASGTVHSFSIANFKAFATALASFVAGNTKVLLGLSTTLPPASVTIA